MRLKIQWIGLQTLIRRELNRMLKMASQIFLPPILTTALYFLIFGSVMGHRIGPILGISYLEFITPGLIVMAIITNAYLNVSFSLFVMRFQHSIEEILVSPLKNSMMLLGLVTGGVMRAVLTAGLLLGVAWFFTHHGIIHWGLLLLLTVLIGIVFSLGGFINALLAHRFEDASLIPTFLLTPLSYLGGIFYTISMLPIKWQFIMQYNPIYYLVNGYRYACYDVYVSSLTVVFSIIGGLIVVLLLGCVGLLRYGVGLQK